MSPDNVFVVYDQLEDTIHSVHSVIETAMAERNRLIRVFVAAGKLSPSMRFCIDKLSVVEQWLKFVDDGPKDDKTSDYFEDVEIIQDLEKEINYAGAS